jgi:hypothetical protein
VRKLGFDQRRAAVVQLQVDAAVLGVAVSLQRVEQALGGPGLMFHVFVILSRELGCEWSEPVEREAPQ